MNSTSTWSTTTFGRRRSSGVWSCSTSTCLGWESSATRWCASSSGMTVACAPSPTCLERPPAAHRHQPVHRQPLSRRLPHHRRLSPAHRPRWRHRDLVPRTCHVQDRPLSTGTNGFVNFFVPKTVTNQRQLSQSPSTRSAHMNDLYNTCMQNGKTTRPRLQAHTRSSAITKRSRDAPCRWKFC